MIRNKSYILSDDQGINRKKNGKLLQQCALMQFSALFVVDTSINEKLLNLFLKSFNIYQKEGINLVLIG